MSICMLIVFLHSSGDRRRIRGSPAFFFFCLLPHVLSNILATAGLYPSWQHAIQIYSFSLNIQFDFKWIISPPLIKLIHQHFLWTSANRVELCRTLLPMYICIPILTNSICVFILALNKQNRNVIPRSCQTFVIVHCGISLSQSAWQSYFWELFFSR